MQKALYKKSTNACGWCDWSYECERSGKRKCYKETIAKKKLRAKSKREWRKEYSEAYRKDDIE